MSTDLVPSAGGRGLDLPATDPGPAGLVRVTVHGRGRRADLVVPGSVPVADLLPELAASVGALDPYLVHAGYRVVLPGGAALTPAGGLVAQGVLDGTVLTLEVGAEAPAARVYDDVVEAVADAVEQQVTPWDPAASRRTALVAASLLLVVAACALGVQRTDGVLVAVAAGALAALLLAACGVLARGQDEPEAALALAWLSVPYAVVAGLAALPDEPVLGLPLALAGTGALVAGGAGTALLLRHRPLLLPALVVGAGAAVAGAVVGTSDLEAAPVVAVVLAVTVVLGAVLPTMALGMTAVRAPVPGSELALPSVAPGVDGAEVARQVRTGRELQRGLALSCGLVVVLGAPLLVRLGVSGLLLGAVACLVVATRTRTYRSRTEVAVGMVAALAGLVALVTAAAVGEPGWRGALTGVLVLAAVLLLLASAVPRSSSVRWSRTVEVVEVAAVVALVPLLVLALGVVGQVRS